MSRSGGWWFRSDTGDDARVSPQCAILDLLTSTNPRPRKTLACLRLLFAPPSTFLLFFFLLFFFLVASYAVTLGQGPKAAPGAVASYEATRPAAAEGPANSSVPKQQRAGARHSGDIPSKLQLPCQCCLVDHLGGFAMGTQMRGISLFPLVP